MNNTDLQQYWFPLLLVLIWTVIWKGWALWRAARQADKAWFIVILVLNTVGILEIFYIFVFSRRHKLSDPVDQLED